MIEDKKHRIVQPRIDSTRVVDLRAIERAENEGWPATRAMPTASAPIDPVQGNSSRARADTLRTDIDAPKSGRLPAPPGGSASANHHRPARFGQRHAMPLIRSRPPLAVN